MIHYIKGFISDVLPGMVIIENNNIGYEVFVPDNSIAYSVKSQEMITLYTAMIVREDNISLYGFSDTQSLAMFNMLLTVSGVGAKGAMAILSALNVEQLKQAICFEDVNAITKANGIGKKTAQRIVLELKDKVAKMGGELISAASVSVNNNAKDEAAAALMALGYSKTEALSLLVGITENDLSTEEYIRRALRTRR